MLIRVEVFRLYIYACTYFFPYQHDSSPYDLTTKFTQTGMKSLLSNKYKVCAYKKGIKTIFTCRYKMDTYKYASKHLLFLSKAECLSCTPEKSPLSPATVALLDREDKNLSLF